MICQKSTFFVVYFGGFHRSINFPCSNGSLVAGGFVAKARCSVDD